MISTKRKREVSPLKARTRKMNRPAELNPDLLRLVFCFLDLNTLHLKVATLCSCMNKIAASKSHLEAAIINIYQVAYYSNLKTILP